MELCINTISDSATNFKEISNSENLIKYLTDTNRRLERTEYIHHYTKLDSILNIIRNEYWILKNPLQMNDQNEIEHWSRERWKQIYFISFMKEQKESVGMWSMYAQPWETGVKVSITKQAIKKWIKSIDKIYYANPENYTVDESEFVAVGTNRKQILLSAVAYTNYEDKNKEPECLECGTTAKNKRLRNIYKNSNLIGYIKNNAWSYEKEMRLRVELEKPYPAVALKLTDDLISGITITKGPRFEGDLEATIKRKLQKSIKTDKSLFFQKISNISCDHCNYKEHIKYEKEKDYVNL